MAVWVHAAAADLVQVGLPEMRACLLDQQTCARRAGRACAQPRDEFEPTGTAADDDDAVQAILFTFMNALSPAAIIVMAQQFTVARGQWSTHARTLASIERLCAARECHGMRDGVGSRACWLLALCRR